jgi:hypothetical protein
MNLAPVIIFAYNRPALLNETMQCLEKCDLAADTIVYVFADAAKDNPSDKLVNDIQEVRKVLAKKWRFKELIVTVRQSNFGLFNNVTQGVTQVINEHEKVIVVEDDIFVSKGFLQYMNAALEAYKHDQNVGGISGFQLKTAADLPETHFVKKTSSWGWGSWKRVWDQVNFNAPELLNEISIEKHLISEFNFKNGCFYDMLKDRSKGRNNSWAICFYASIYLSNQLFLYPRQSLCTNAGFGHEDATHTRGSKKPEFYWKYAELRQYVNFEKVPIIENVKARRIWEKSLSKSSTSLFTRILKSIRSN